MDKCDKSWWNLAYWEMDSLLYCCSGTFAKLQSDRSPGGSICKGGLPVQLSVHFNIFQMTNS